MLDLMRKYLRTIVSHGILNRLSDYKHKDVHQRETRNNSFFRK
jgi:hypothetical protein